MTPEPWEELRAELNHDWLKNEFHRKLRAFTERLADYGRDHNTRLREFISRDWPLWAGKRDRIAGLLNEAEAQLSPFSHPWLAVPTWLSTVAHELWASRTGVRSAVLASRQALETADLIHRRIQMKLDLGDVDVDVLRDCCSDFVAFAASITELSKCLSALPHSGRLSNVTS